MPDMDTSAEDAARERIRLARELEMKKVAEQRAAQEAQRILDEEPRWKVHIWLKGHKEVIQFARINEVQKNALEMLKRGRNYDYDGDFIKSDAVARLSIQPTETDGAWNRRRSMHYRGY